MTYTNRFFKPGDKVVCTQNDMGMEDTLRVGQVYTVKDDRQNGFVALTEVIAVGLTGYSLVANRWRFRHATQEELA